MKRSTLYSAQAHCTQMPSVHPSWRARHFAALRLCWRSSIDHILRHGKMAQRPSRLRTRRGIAIPLEIADKASIEKALNALLNDPKFKKAALAWRERLRAERSAGETIATICDRMRGCLMRTTSAPTRESAASTQRSTSPYDCGDIFLDGKVISD